MENDLVTTAAAETSNGLSATHVQPAQEQQTGDYAAKAAAMDAEIQAARDKQAGELVSRHTTQDKIGDIPFERVDVKGIAQELNGISNKPAQEEAIKATLNHLDHPQDQASLKSALGLPDTYNKSWGAAFMENTALGRVIGAGAGGMRDGWGDRQLGFGPQTVQTLRDYNVFSNPVHGMQPTHAFNEVTLGGGSMVADGIFRGVSSAYYGIADGVGQVATEVGLPNGKGLARDLKAMPEAFAGGGIQSGINKTVTAANNAAKIREATTLPPIGGKSGHLSSVWPLPGGSGRAYAGHGGARIASGETVVPNGTSVTLPRADASILNRTGRFIERGDWEGLAAAAKRNPVIADDIRGMTTHLPGSTIPNYSLRSPEGLVIHWNSATVGQEARLSDLLKPNMGCVHWAACTVLEKK